MRGSWVSAVGDLAVALCMALIGLALAATSRALIRRGVRAPEPVQV